MKLKFLLFLLPLAITLYTFRDFGITWDEQDLLFYGQSISDFYTSFGKIDNATRATDLINFYGGLFDLCAHAFTKLFSFDRYEGRHLFNALVGLLGIVGMFQLGKRLRSERLGILAATLLFLTPLYFGHMFNNPKDIPFAVAYLWSAVVLIDVLRGFPNLDTGLTWRAGLVFGLTLSTRIGGALVIFYFLILILIKCLINRPSKDDFISLLRQVFFVGLISWIVMLSAWPFSLVRPFSGPFIALREFSKFNWDSKILFKGQWFVANDLPWDYIPHYLFAKLPEITAVAFFLFLCRWIALRRWSQEKSLLVFMVFFPISYAILTRATLYDGIRHFLFVAPLVTLLAALTLDELLSHSNKIVKSMAVGFTLVALSSQAYRMIELHPYEYIFYNRFMGGLKGAAYRYELDYWGHSFKKAAEELNRYLDKNPMTKNPILVFSCGPGHAARYYFHQNIKLLPRDGIKPDFLILLNRYECLNTYGGEVIAEIKRDGILLAVVKKSQ